MAVPFTQLASTYLDNYDTELNDALKRADGIVAVLGAKGRIKEELGGGDNFRTRIMYAGNPNIAFGSKSAQITTLITEGITMASVPQRIIKGAIVINDIDRDRAAKQGEWAIGQLIEDNMKQAKSQYVQVWADALRTATPDAAVGPYSLLPNSTNAANGILTPQAGAAQTATTAGISRADNSWWRNQYTNTSIDISSEAGRASLHAFYLECVFGSSRDDEPDFGLTSGAVIADIAAAVDTNRRADYESAFLAKLGLSGIMFQNAALVRDSSTRLANKVAFINTRDLELKFLRGQGGVTKENWDQNNGMGMIPVNVLPFKHDIDSLHTIALLYATASLVPSQLRTHGLADNVV